MRLLFVISVALGAAGCGDREAARLDKVKTAVCACKTASCAEAALKQVPQAEIKSTHRAQRIAREMLDCLKRVYDAERPTTDPDAPAPESAGHASTP
jgi:hypothetical protein